MRGLLIACHPDDETLWGGGFMLRNPGEWTVLCLTRPLADPARIHGFRRACAVFNATAIVIGHSETPELPLAFDVSGFDIILTHNADGEYGHRHHKQTHAYVANATHHFKPPYTMPDEIPKVMEALRCYDHKSPLDGGLMKWEALL